MRGDESCGQVREQVAAAAASGSPLTIVGGRSKSFFARPSTGRELHVFSHCGVIEYEPTELVITARAGTPLAVIEKILADNGQMLAFEPPHFGATATLGGTIACGLSGPRRPYAGSARDCVLGVKLINGTGEILNFGGRVMKNVAGFDVSRLMVGAFGTLGILLEISLKVLPKPQREETLRMETAPEQALAVMGRLAGDGWPLSAACHDGERLYLRFSGAEAAIQACAKKLGGESVDRADVFWTDVREQRLDFFRDESPLWRISVPPASPHLTRLSNSCFVDWGGALRWTKTDAAPESVFKLAGEAGGHASLFRNFDPGGPFFQPLPQRLKTLHLQLKQAFDPKGIFNPRRICDEW